MTKQQKNSKWTGKLSSTFVAKPLEPGYYSDHEVPGLKLRVQHTKSKGISKSWVHKVEIDELVTHISHGCYPAVTLEEARRRAWAALNEIAAKRDPRIRNGPTVRDIGDQVIEERSGSPRIWRSDGTRKRWEHNLRAHVYPKIGHLRVTEVNSAHIMACVQPLVGKPPETARQVLSHLRVIFGRVRGENLRGDDPTEVVGSALGPIKTRNRPMQSVPYDQVAEALQKVENSGAHWSTKAVFKMMAYTGARQEEIRGARWEEIDLDNAIHSVPADRTKSGRRHRIPLSGPALAVLNDARERTGGIGLVFPSRTGRPISNGTLRKLLKAYKVACVPHGLRSSFRTWAAEHSIDDKVAELALGHTVPGIGAGIDLLEQRRAAVEQWAQYLMTSTIPRLTMPAPPPPTTVSQHLIDPEERKKQWLSTDRNDSPTCSFERKSKSPGGTPTGPAATASAPPPEGSSPASSP